MSGIVIDAFSMKYAVAKDDAMEYKGHDYLMAYRLGRYANLLPAEM